VLGFLMSKMASFEEAVRIVCEKYNLKDLNTYQREALTEFVLNRRDVFVNLPTGSGKSMIYLALPLLFDSMHPDNNHTGHVVVASCAAVLCVGPTIPPHERLLNDAEHSFPIVI
jgi:superfamily II DNA/RNA helicase